MSSFENMSFGHFDEIEESSFDIIPANTVVQLRAVYLEMKDTAARNGKYIKVTFDIIDGQYQGRKIFENYNVVNQNSDAVQIALKNIKAWLIATGGEASGELKMSTIESLEGKVFSAKLGVKVDKTGQYSDQNTIKVYLPPNGSKPAQSKPAQQRAAEPTAEKKPWE